MLPLVLTRFHDLHLKTGESTELRENLEPGMDGGPGSNSVEQLLKMELITILKHNKVKAGLQRSPQLMKQKRDITDRGIQLTF